MSSTEIFGWMEYFGKYPFSYEKADLQHAELCLLINRMLGGKAKFEDFLPSYMEPEAQKKSLEQQRSEFAGFTQKLRQMTGKA